MRINDWTPERKPQPQALVDAILARRGGRLLNLDRALLWSEPVARGWNVFSRRFAPSCQPAASCASLASAPWHC